jgi:hypothetical protein
MIPNSKFRLGRPRTPQDRLELMLVLGFPIPPICIGVLRDTERGTRTGTTGLRIIYQEIGNRNGIIFITQG